MSVVFILLGFGLLVIGGEYLVRSSVVLSFRLKLSKMVIGLTVVSFATSAPEMLVSLQAALNGFSDISLGNIIGSNIANIGLVLGITAIISPLIIDRDFYKFNWHVLVFFSVLFYFFLKSGNEISRPEGFIFLILIGIYLFFLIRRSRREHKKMEGVDESLRTVSNFKMIVWLIIGGAALWGGSELLVTGAVDIAEMLGVSERVISITMIAVGTSVPELAASVTAALKKEKALSLGNLIGSNIFNIASVLGITSIIRPIALKSQELLTNDMWWMIGFAVVLIPLAFLPRKLELSRYKGVILFVAYAIFVGLAFLKK